MTFAPKSLGRDCELSTTGTGPRGDAIAPWNVTRRVLEHVGAAFEPYGTEPWTRAAAWSDGRGSAPRRERFGSASSSDCLRHWAPNGQCFYSDMSHVEVCTAETRSPRAFAAQCLGVLRVAEAARRRAEEAADPGTRFALSAANVDLVDPGISWGSHLNVEVSRDLWEDLLGERRHPATLASVTSALAAAIPFFGCGYLMPQEDGSALFSLSARAHHLSLVECVSTVEAFRRGILNARREPHAAESERLHLIGFDFALAGAAPLAAFLQSLLAASERGFVGPILWEPVHALRTWSWGLDLRAVRLNAVAPLADRRTIALPEIVAEIASWLLRLHEAGDLPDDAAPEWRALLPRVVELAGDLARGDVARCGRHLDWAAKLLVLLHASGDGSLEFGDPEMRLLDHDFANTDPEAGAFWRLWARGAVDPLVRDEDVDACLRDGPPECRGWARGRLVQRFAPEITAIDWDRVELRLDGDRFARRARISMPRVDSLRRDAFEPLLTESRDAGRLADLLERTGLVEDTTHDPVWSFGSGGDTSHRYR